MTFCAVLYVHVHVHSCQSWVISISKICNQPPLYPVMCHLPLCAAVPSDVSVVVKGNSSALISWKAQVRDIFVTESQHEWTIDLYTIQYKSSEILAYKVLFVLILHVLSFF